MTAGKGTAATFNYLKHCINNKHSHDCTGSQESRKPSCINFLAADLLPACPPLPRSASPFLTFHKSTLVLLLAFSLLFVSRLHSDPIGITKSPSWIEVQFWSKWKKLSTPQNPLQISFLFWLLIPAWFPLSSLPYSQPALRLTSTI